MVLEDNSAISVAYRNAIAREVKEWLNAHSQLEFDPRNMSKNQQQVWGCTIFSYISFITNRPRPLNHPIAVLFAESRAPINSQRFNWSLPSIKFCATINDKTFYQRVAPTQNREGIMDSIKRLTIIRKYEQKSAIIEKAFQWTSNTNSSTK